MRRERRGEIQRESRETIETGETRETRERTESSRLKRFPLGRHIFCVIARLGTSRGNLLGGALSMRSPRSQMLARDDKEQIEDMSI